LEREESASFLKKRSKKLLIPVGLVAISAKFICESKVFCFFCLQKEVIASLFAFSTCLGRARPGSNYFYRDQCNDAIKGIEVALPHG
jgi:hypothetical protein